jgi:hypothetical protein
MLLEVECFTVDDFDSFHWLFQIEVFIYASGSRNIYASSQNLMSTKESLAVLYIPFTLRHVNVKNYGTEQIFSVKGNVNAVH